MAFPDWGALTDVEISTNYALDFNPLPSLPKAMQSSCLVIVGTDKIFSIGGWTGMKVAGSYITAWPQKFTHL